MNRKEALKQGVKQYFTGKPCKRGHIANRDTRSARCSVCLTEQRTKYARRRRQRSPVKVLYEAAQARAKKRGIVFTITPSDMPTLPTVCPVLGIPVSANSGMFHSESPSLDRIDSNKGYEAGNIRIISWRANRLKSDGTLEEFEKIVNDLKNQ